MTRNKALVTTIVVIGLIALLLLVRTPRPKIAKPPAELPVTVSVAKIQRRDLPLAFLAAGRAEAKASVLVKARLDGQVAEVAYREGQPVRRGQLLVRLDSAVLQSQERQAEGVIARDEAQVAKAKDLYQRNVDLAGRGYVSQLGLNQAQADLKTADANLKVDNASLDTARLQVGYARVIAPMDGVAGALLVPVGGAIKANDTTLMVINQVKPINVTFAVPEAQLAPLKLAKNKGEVAVNAFVVGVSVPIHGTLWFIDNAVDMANGTIAAKAVFENADGMLTPGQFVQVSVQLDQLRNALVVPSQAVESGVDGPYAFVINPDDTAAIRQLAVGPDTSGYRVVISGLAAGERVVMAGQAQLRDKARVSIRADPLRSDLPQ